MAKEFLFNGILSWGGILSVLYFFLGSRTEIKKCLVGSWTVIAVALMICIVNRWM